MDNFELLKRMVDTHKLNCMPYEVFLGKLQTYLNTQLTNKEVLTEMFKKSGQMDAMIECPDCGTHTLLGFKDCNFCGCNLLENVEQEEFQVGGTPVEKAVKPNKEVEKAVKPNKEVEKADNIDDTSLSNTETGSLDNVTEEEGTILKMRMPNLIRIVNKYGLDDQINVNDEKKYGGRKIKALRNDICDALFGPLEDEEEVETPVEEVKKKAPVKEAKKKVVKKEPVQEVEEEEEFEEEETQYTESGDLPPLPERDEIFAMSREELIALIKAEDLDVSAKRFRKLEKLQEEVDRAIEELDGDEFDEEDTGVSDDTPVEDEDEFGLDDLSEIDDEELELD